MAVYISVLDEYMAYIESDLPPLLTIQSGKKSMRIQVSHVSHTVPTHTGTGQWDSGTTVENQSSKTSHEQLFVTEI